MSKSWKDVRAKHAHLAPDAPGMQEARERTRKAEEDYELRLAALRKARRLTQAQLAAQLGLNQPSISKLERQTDLFLSTLRRYVEATGGRLRLTAEYDDASIPLDYLSGDDDETTPTTGVVEGIGFVDPAETMGGTGVVPNMFVQGSWIPLNLSQLGVVGYSPRPWGRGRLIVHYDQTSIADSLENELQKIIKEGS